jgi:hypothetical protein
MLIHRNHKQLLVNNLRRFLLIDLLPPNTLRIVKICSKVKVCETVLVYYWKALYILLSQNLKLLHNSWDAKCLIFNQTRVVFEIEKFFSSIFTLYSLGIWGWLRPCVIFLLWLQQRAYLVWRNFEQFVNQQRHKSVHVRNHKRSLAWSVPLGLLLWQSFL